MKLLDVEALNVYYGSIHAIKNVFFEIKKGEIVALIGANGAGKTTILHTVSGLIQAKSGEISFKGLDILKEKPYNLVKMGMAHTPEGRRIFTDLTVLENLEMGGYILDREKMKKNISKMFKLFPKLKERKNQLAGTMSGGEQQMLAIARSLMSEPEILLLDEPSMGLAPLLVQEIFNIIKKINEDGVTVLLVEQNANQALSIADRAYVLETGEIVLDGTGKELLNNKSIKKAYLGS
ncbi:ABC transporter ATP-binding protein [Oceanivirga salmonicida]|uniref:ABC transporter ATP-binding protein n=1 Tax=Oceanivirga salmonicida TaxID=1769291 RepID=UPI00082D4D30|nr:ABC transporter ATP-binding protein [Oceanivirga salmonicida]